MAFLGGKYLAEIAFPVLFDSFAMQQPKGPWHRRRREKERFWIVNHENCGALRTEFWSRMGADTSAKSKELMQRTIPLDKTRFQNILRVIT
jgi:hypothetical protein